MPGFYRFYLWSKLVKIFIDPHHGSAATGSQTLFPEQGEFFIRCCTSNLNTQLLSRVIQKVVSSQQLAAYVVAKQNDVLPHWPGVEHGVKVATDST